MTPDQFIAKRQTLYLTERAASQSHFFDLYALLGEKPPFTNDAANEKRRANVVGNFRDKASIVRLFGAVLMEANDEWQLRHRYLSI